VFLDSGLTWSLLATVMKKCHMLYFPKVLPLPFCRGIFSITVALIFTAVLHIFTHGGRKVGAHSKDRFYRNFMGP